MSPAIAHALSERCNDCYETPPEAVRALMAVEPLPERLWEPACGPGAIVRELRAVGHDVLATDLVDYGCENSQSGVDFLLPGFDASDRQAIVTNPPFKLASEFVARALELCPLVVMLLRLQFLEGSRRSPIIDGGHLARVNVFRNRLPMMHRDGWEGPRAPSTTAYAWFVWDRAHTGPTTLNRISWVKA